MTSISINKNLNLKNVLSSVKFQQKLIFRTIAAKKAHWFLLSWRFIVVRELTFELTDTRRESNEPPFPMKLTTNYGEINFLTAFPNPLVFFIYFSLLQNTHIASFVCYCWYIFYIIENNMIIQTKKFFFLKCHWTFQELKKKLYFISSLPLCGINNKKYMTWNNNKITSLMIM